MHYRITSAGTFVGLLLAGACSESVTSAQPTKGNPALGRGGFEVWILGHHWLGALFRFGK